MFLEPDESREGGEVEDAGVGPVTERRGAGSQLRRIHCSPSWGCSRVVAVGESSHHHRTESSRVEVEVETASLRVDEGERRFTGI